MNDQKELVTLNLSSEETEELRLESEIRNRAIRQILEPLRDEESVTIQNFTTQYPDAGSFLRDYAQAAGEAAVEKHRRLQKASPMDLIRNVFDEIIHTTQDDASNSSSFEQFRLSHIRDSWKLCLQSVVTAAQSTGNVLSLEDAVKTSITISSSDPIALAIVVADGFLNFVNDLSNDRVPRSVDLNGVLPFMMDLTGPGSSEDVLKRLEYLGKEENLADIFATLPTVEYTTPEELDHLRWGKNRTVVKTSSFDILTGLQNPSIPGVAVDVFSSMKQDGGRQGRLLLFHLQPDAIVRSFAEKFNFES